jgi:glycosyltransferase involved in cell wall biosynthesis
MVHIFRDLTSAVLYKLVEKSKYENTSSEREPKPYILVKIGLLSRSDLDGGAAVFGLRLFVKLREQNADVKYLVGIKHGLNESTLLYFKSPFFTKLRNYFERLLLKNRNGNFPFSLCLFPFPLKLLLSYHNIDLVHIHWIGAGFISIRSLKRIRIPIIWTMHDSWPFTGGCHIPYNCEKFRHNCGKCPELNSQLEDDLSRKIFNLKRRFYNQIKNITFVSPSNWLAESAFVSTLLKDKKVIVIPNGIDTELFSPKNKAGAREYLNVSPLSKIVLFGAVNSTSDKNKGFLQLLSALKQIDIPDVEIMVFGSTGDALINTLAAKTVFLGKISDENLMALIYSAADVTVVPSLSENLSLVIMESLSCGTPVVAFNVGGNSELVDHKVNGYLAEPFSTADFSNGIKWVLEKQGKTDILSRKAREKIINNFDINLVVKKYFELYQRLMK